MEDFPVTTCNKTRKQFLKLISIGDVASVGVFGGSSRWSDGDGSGGSNLNAYFLDKCIPKGI